MADSTTMRHYNKLQRVGFDKTSFVGGIFRASVQPRVPSKFGGFFRVTISAPFFLLTIRTQSKGEMSLTRLLNEHQSKQAALRRDNGRLGHIRHRRHLFIEDRFYSDD